MNTSLILIWGFFTQKTTLISHGIGCIMAAEANGIFPFHGSFEEDPHKVISGWIGKTTDKVGIATITEIDWYHEESIRFKKQYEDTEEYVLYDLKYDSSNKWYEGTWQIVEKEQKTLSGFARTFLVPTTKQFFQK